MEKLNSQLSYLLQFKGCFKVFPVIKYTYVPCLKIAMLCVFAFCSLIAFMVHWAIAYPEPCQTSKMGLFVKIVTSKEVTSLLRRSGEHFVIIGNGWKPLSIITKRSIFDVAVALDPSLDVWKGSEYASAECKENCFATFWLILQYILGLK